MGNFEKVPATDLVIDGPTRHLGVSGVAAELGVTVGTVTKWIRRYPPQVGTHPTPTPDVMVDDIMGWSRGRMDEWRQWRADMPGQGAGGGRPRKTAAETLQDRMAAAADDFEREHAAEWRRASQPE